MSCISEQQKDLKAFLRGRKVTPTTQRLQIAQALFERSAHFSADEIYVAVNKLKPSVSKATVYNTLGLFVEKGLIKEVLVDPSKVFYDSNTEPHHHFYDVDTGEIQDIALHRITVNEMPEIPDGKQFDSLQVLVRVRTR